MPGQLSGGRQPHRELHAVRSVLHAGLGCDLRVLRRLRLGELCRYLHQWGDEAIEPVLQGYRLQDRVIDL